MSGQYKGRMTDDGETVEVLLLPDHQAGSGYSASQNTGNLHGSPSAATANASCQVRTKKEQKTNLKLKKKD